MLLDFRKLHAFEIECESIDSYFDGYRKLINILINE